MPHGGQAMRFRRSARRGMCVIAGSCLLVAAPLPTTAVAASRVVAHCVNHAGNFVFVTKPRFCAFYFGGPEMEAFGYNTSGVRSLRWTNWGGKTARATGVLSRTGSQVHIRLWRRVACDSGNYEKADAGYTRFRMSGPTIRTTSHWMLLPEFC